METLDPDLLADWAGGTWRFGKPERLIGFSNDTRSLGDGDCFAAFATDRRDGHDFLRAAKEAGATAGLVQRPRADAELPQLEVSDVGRALIEMAARYRRTWSQSVIGITGSCGKTTCKELVSLTLGRERVLSTKGNLNNLIGVPMSILRPVSDRTRFVVLEAGISEVGEMDQLARMIDPDVAVFTAIGPAHLEGLGSETNVAMEKGLLAQRRRVRQVFAGETCERYAGYLGGLKAKIVRADPQLALDWSYRFRSEAGQTVFEQSVFGRVERFGYRGVGMALASNVALAVAVAASLGVGRDRIQQGLSAWQPPKLRGEWRRSGAARAYLDCYNANPLSMKDAIATFVASSRPDWPRLFIIGCMEELGAMSETYHEEMGIEMPFRKEDLLLVLGGQAASVLRGMENVGHDMSRCRAIGSIDEARRLAREFEGDIFLKGSRRYRLEEALGEDFVLEPTSGGDVAPC